MPLLGIVVPTFSHSEHLKELIASLDSQSDPRWEALIVDDSGSGAVHCQLSVKASQGRISWMINQQNQGIPQAWNTGLQHLYSLNKYAAVAVVHDDDVLHHDYVKTSLSLLHEYPTVAVFHFRTKVVGSDGLPTFSIQDIVKSLFSPQLWGRNFVSFGDRGLARILNNNFVFCPSMVFNLQSLSKLQFDARWRFVTDLHLVSNLLLNGYTFLRSPRAMYRYRRHDKNMTATLTKSTERFREEIALYKELQQQSLKSGFQRSARAAQRRSSIKRHIIYQMVLSLLDGDWVKLKKLRNHFVECTTQ